ncbi:hypothetical protein LT330_007843 [Penicillium expansum]|uniref:Uncharacterized protein n=1 Tax=Penicillium expansum TaxID=27334 RepID=A0A0A2JMK5_PENEN|nr:hypothetical protein PEX2_029930 [Penicillium expansum]KAJ5506819.1 hypothetical protein N7453_005776 [Penicillium expansum]KAK4867102.1 hypothetical protein LT330_007843 [Penicillium expansum]KGO39311.1 hypothetical protein PEXP_043920 [Penicillium expansum]KGO55175.1 hypothetical protein PEX2_029930 [Penicillium expansum]KGO56056.1 hypothetical protein PEX1_094870 [Penicillium expansum]
MVKLSILSIASVAAFASLGAAKNCQTKFDYCSSALLSRGNYDTQIRNAVADAQSAFPGVTRDNALFACLGGSNGEIKVIQKCGYQCKNGGDGHTDSC